MTALREFITELDDHGLLKHVDSEVNWKYEIGAIARSSETPLIFENIKDYPNKRLFSNGLADYSSIAIAIGLREKNVRFKRIVETLAESFNNPIEPILIDNTSITENCITDGIDLTILPIPWWSELDAGRFIGTWHLNVSCDLETGVRNIGVYRMQIIGPNQTTVSVSPKSHLSLQIHKAEKKDKPLPMAVAIGVDERIVISAASAPAYGVDEYSLAGGLVGDPIELIPCLTQKLDVPADSEIVIEGFIKLVLGYRMDLSLIMQGFLILIQMPICLRPLLSFLKTISSFVVQPLVGLERRIINCTQFFPI